MLGRYVGRRVCVSTFGHSKLWGELAAINDDCMRLVNTSHSTDGDDQWMAQNQYGDPDSNYGLRHAETIIHFHHVVSITCLDDDLPILNDFHAPPTAFESPADSGQATASRATSRQIVAETDHTVDDAFARLHVERLEIRLGSDLVGLADPKRGGDLLDRLHSLRSLIGSQLGIILPHTRVRDDIRLEAREYRIYVGGAEVSRGSLRPEKLLAVSGSGGTKAIIEGERTLEPAFSQPAIWIEPGQRELAEKAGYFAVSPSAVLATHLQRDVRRHAAELFSIDCLKTLLDHVRQSSPAAVDELVPNRFSLTRLLDLLSRLLEEEVALRPLELVLERVARLGMHEDLEEALAALRRSLGRQICERFRDPQGTLSVFTLHPTTHDRISRILLGSMRNQDGTWLARFVDALRTWYFDHRNTSGREIPLVVDANLRRRLKQFLSTHLPTLSVIAFVEIPTDLPVHLVTSLDDDELGIAPRSKNRRKPGKPKASQLATEGSAAARSKPR